LLFTNPDWTIADEQGNVRQVRGPREFRHTLGNLLNGLIMRGFVLLHFDEESSSEVDPEPGSWEHYKLVVAPFMSLWAVYQPHLLTNLAKTQAEKGDQP